MTHHTRFLRLVPAGLAGFLLAACSDDSPRATALVAGGDVLMLAGFPPGGVLETVRIPRTSEAPPNVKDLAVDAARGRVLIAASSGLFAYSLGDRRLTGPMVPDNTDSVEVDGGDGSLYLLIHPGVHDEDRTVEPHAVRRVAGPDGREIRTWRLHQGTKDFFLSAATRTLVATRRTGRLLDLIAVDGAEPPRTITLTGGAARPGENRQALIFVGTLARDGRSLWLVEQGRPADAALWVVDLPSGSARYLPLAHHEGQHYLAAAFTPDGTELILLLERALAVVDPATGAERRLTALGADHEALDVSADGQLIYLAGRSADGASGVVSQVGGPARKLLAASGYPVPLRHVCLLP